MEGKGRSTRQDAISCFVARLRNRNEIRELLNSREREIATYLQEATTHDSSCEGDTEETIAKAARASLKPIIVSWFPIPSASSNFTIVFPDGVGGFSTHDYEDVNLVDVVVDFIRGIYALYLNYPSPARHAWVFVERKLVNLFEGVSDPPPVHAGFKSAISKLEALRYPLLPDSQDDSQLLSSQVVQQEVSSPQIEPEESPVPVTSPDISSPPYADEVAVRLDLIREPVLSEESDSDDSLSECVPIHSRPSTSAQSHYKTIPVGRKGKGAKLPRVPSPEEGSALPKRKRTARKQFSV